MADASGEPDPSAKGLPSLPSTPATMLPAASPTRKPCPVCGEQIAITAKKCVHCGSELNWRRHMSFSTTTLALITALVAVLGAVGPSIKSLFEYRDAFLNFTFIGAGSVRTVQQDGRPTNGSVIILGSNEGHAAGGLVAARLHISWMEGGKRHLAATMLRTAADEPVVIAPGTAQSIRLLFDPSVDPVGRTSAADVAALIVPKTASNIETSPLWKADCSIGLTIADASTDTKDIIIPARCEPMMPTIVQAIRSPGIGM
jgi:predicted nucleic acid-binding Zn ribbon protein